MTNLVNFTLKLVSGNTYTLIGKETVTKLKHFKTKISILEKTLTKLNKYASQYFPT